MQPFLFLLNLKFKNFMKLLIKTSQKISPDFEEEKKRLAHAKCT